MSDHGQAAHAESHAGAGDGHDYTYAGEPADRPGADEPSTPGWLTLLGIGLLLSLILGFIVMQPDGKTRSELTQAAPAAAEPAKANAEPEAAAAPRPPRPLPSGFRPGAMPAGIPSGHPRLVGSGTPLRPGPFAMPGGSARPARPARPDPHAGHDHP